MNSLNDSNWSGTEVIIDDNESLYWDEDDVDIIMKTLIEPIADKDFDMTPVKVLDEDEDTKFSLHSFEKAFHLNMFINDEDPLLCAQPNKPKLNQIASIDEEIKENPSSTPENDFIEYEEIFQSSTAVSDENNNVLQPQSMDIPPRPKRGRPRVDPEEHLLKISTKMTKKAKKILTNNAASCKYRAKKSDQRQKIYKKEEKLLARNKKLNARFQENERIIEQAIEKLKQLQLFKSS